MMRQATQGLAMSGVSGADGAHCIRCRGVGEKLAVIFGSQATNGGGPIPTIAPFQRPVPTSTPGAASACLARGVTVPGMAGATLAGQTARAVTGGH